MQRRSFMIYILILIAVLAVMSILLQPSRCTNRVALEKATALEETVSLTLSVSNVSSTTDLSSPSVLPPISIWEKIEAYTDIVRDTVASGAVAFSNATREAEIENIIAALRNTSVQEEKYIFNSLHGREFPYQLSCPRSKHLDVKQHSVVVAYHVGMVNNWRSIVADQMSTLEYCGLANIMTTMFITFSSKNEKDNNLEDLTRIISRYSFSTKVTYHNVRDLFPYEGFALNLLYEFCLDREEETVAFYFHTKGSSHFVPYWRNMEQPGSHYVNFLFWRKYLEYFLIERPGICIDKIVNGGADACGADLVQWDDGFRFYAGNFWAASCNRHLKSLYKIDLEKLDEVLARGQYDEKYGEPEGWINRPQVPRDLKLVSLHNRRDSPASIAARPIPPEEYSDYSFRWLYK